jgi:hypothetical protein
MTTQEISLVPSVFVPVAIGFFGLAVGYFVWGGQALFGFPKDTLEVNRTMGLWGFWMPGFMQFFTGVYLTVGLSWFGVFEKTRPSTWLRWRSPPTGSIGLRWRTVGTSAPAVSRTPGWPSPSCCFPFWARSSPRRPLVEALLKLFRLPD